MVEGEFKKRLNIAAITGRPEFKDDDLKHPVMVNRKYVLDVLDEAREDFPQYVTSPTMEGYIGFLADVLEWKTKWFGTVENTVK